MPNRRTFNFGCLVAIIALLATIGGALSATGSLSPIIGSPQASRACNGSNCSVYVTVNETNCPGVGQCFSTLDSALERAESNQVVELLDDKVVLEGLVALEQVNNVTIYSKLGTEISIAPNSSDVNGPLFYIFDCYRIILRGIKLHHLQLTESPIIADRSEVVIENFVCESVTLRLVSSSLPAYPGSCISSRSSNLSIRNSNFHMNHAHSLYSGGEARGGAIAGLGGSLYIYSSNFSSNTAVADTSYGGAIYLKNGYLKLADSRFIGNHISGVSYCAGGAVFQMSGSLDIISCVFINNTVLVVEPMGTGFGGALHQYSKPVLPLPTSYYASIADSTFAQNEVHGVGELEGGALALTVRSIVLYKSTFTSNRVLSPHPAGQLAERGSLTVRGGAASLVGHDIEVYMNAFRNNTAAGADGYSPGWAHGGGLHLITDRFGSSSMASHVSVNRNLFRLNRAQGGRSTEANTGGGAAGGGLRVVALDADISITSNSFSRNYAIGGDGPVTGGPAEGAGLVVNHLSYAPLTPVSLPPSDTSSP